MQINRKNLLEVMLELMVLRKYQEKKKHPFIINIAKLFNKDIN